MSPSKAVKAPKNKRETPQELIEKHGVGADWEGVKQDMKEVEFKKDDPVLLKYFGPTPNELFIYLVWKMNENKPTELDLWTSHRELKQQKEQLEGKNPDSLKRALLQLFENMSELRKDKTSNLLGGKLKLIEVTKKSVFNVLKKEFPELESKQQLFKTNEQFAREKIEKDYPGEQKVILHQAYINYYNRHGCRPLDLVRTEDELLSVSPELAH